MAHRALFRATCPPRKKDLGTKLREVKAVPTLPHVFTNLTSTARGLPIVSAKEDIDRCSLPGLPSQKEGQPLLPKKETAARRTYQIKVQRQDAVNALCSFENFSPSDSLGAARAVFKRKELRFICMAVGPLTVNRRATDQSEAFGVPLKFDLHNRCNRQRINPKGHMHTRKDSQGNIIKQWTQKLKTGRVMQVFKASVLRERLRADPASKPFLTRKDYQINSTGFVTNKEAGVESRLSKILGTSIKDALAKKADA